MMCLKVTTKREAGGGAEKAVDGTIHPSRRRAACRNLKTTLQLDDKGYVHFLFSCVFAGVQLCPFTSEVALWALCASNNWRGREDVHLLPICSFEGGMVRIIT
jgi:hypothetical protein